jgi:hypothetical protein
MDMNTNTKFSSTLASIALVIVCATASNQALASLVELKMDEAGRFQHQADIKAGGILEVCGKLTAGQKIDWQFSSPNALDFNIHFHEGKKVSLPVKQKARKESAGQFAVIKDQDYCWMWSNKSKSIANVSLQLSHAPSK